MLVLARHLREGVILHPPGCPEIRVVVVEIRGDKVRLGFTADPTVAIYRDEVELDVRAHGSRIAAKQRQARKAEGRNND